MENKKLFSIIRENIKNHKYLESWLEKRFQEQRVLLRRTLVALRQTRTEISELESRIKGIDNKR